MKIGGNTFNMLSSFVLFFYLFLLPQSTPQGQQQHSIPFFACQHLFFDGLVTKGPTVVDQADAHLNFSMWAHDIVFLKMCWMSEECLDRVWHHAHLQYLLVH